MRQGQSGFNKDLIISRIFLYLFLLESKRSKIRRITRTILKLILMQFRGERSKFEISSSPNKFP